MDSPSKLASRARRASTVKKTKLPQKVGEQHSKRLSVETARYTDAIKNMEEEVKILEKRLQQRHVNVSKQVNRQEEDTLTQTLAAESDHRFEQHFVQQAHDVVVDHKENMALTAISGIRITSATSSLKQQTQHQDDGKHRVRAYMLEGQSTVAKPDLRFTLKFDVDEGALDDAQSVPRVTSVDVNVWPPLAHTEMASLIRRVQHKHALQEFFRAFVCFAQQQQQRVLLFERVHRQHTQHIHIPHGQYGRVLHFTPQGPFVYKFKLVYSLTYDTHTRNVQPQLALHMSPNSQLSDKGKKLVLDMPSHFRDLCVLKGVYGAICVLCEQGLPM